MNLKKMALTQKLVVSFLLIGMLTSLAVAAGGFSVKPNPDKVVSILKAGNKRFYSGQSAHAHTDKKRLMLAGTENQGNHALATVIACSDSRVPVERLFDAGVMDIFTIRVAGNVLDVDEIGSVEYGISHVNTPVFVVLGHTQCGAVTAVSSALAGKGHALERNIPPLVDNIIPAVENVMSSNRGADLSTIIPLGIEQNVWQGVEDLFMESPAARRLVNEGKVKVVGAIYDVATGKINWLPEGNVPKILSRVERSGNMATNEFAEGGHGEEGEHEGEAEHAEESSHGSDASGEEEEANHLLFIILGFAFVTISISAITIYLTKNRTIQIRLYSSFGLIGLILVIFIGVVYNLLHQSSIELEILAEDEVPMMAAMSSFESGMLHDALLFGRYSETHKKSDLTKAHKIEKENFEILKEVQKEIEHGLSRATDDEMVKEMNKLKEEIKVLHAAYEEYTDDGDAMIDAIDNRQRAKIAALKKERAGDEEVMIHEAAQIIDEIRASAIHESELAHTQIEEVLGLLLAVGILTILIAAILAFIISASILSSISKFVDILKDIAEGEGDLTRRVELPGNDEIKVMAKWFNQFIGNVQEIIRSIKNTTETVASASEELSAVSNQMLAGSEEMVNQATSVAGATEQMSTNITTMASAAEEMSVNANEVAGAAEQTSQNMNAVSSAVEEMSVSIGQIAQDAGTAREVSDQASASSQKATTTMGTLSEAAKEIGNVTEVIKRIAEQTNLLALNATIEAASAGEAGKGFAVVANEIKELANQSAKAADDIATRIDGVQSNTDDAVNVINDVTEVIEKVSSTITNIAQAVEQQNGAVNDISANVVQAGSGVENIAASIAEVAKGANDVSRNSGEASKGATDVTTNISGIQAAAQETSSGAGQVNISATDLSKMAADLQNIVGQFTI
jgi:methyl-accepting chemotaxis protein/carbonic anhydrase